MSQNPWISDLHWVRAGQQPRSQKTQESLLDAAETLFVEKGADATSVADVADRAGCSVGAVYHHFRDKKALLFAIFGRMSERYRETTRAAVDPARWEGAAIADILRSYLEFSLETGRARPAFKQAALEASRLEPELREHLAELHEEFSRGLTKLLLARIGEIGHPDPVLAVGFVIDQTASMIKTRLDPTLLRTRLRPYSDEEFVRESLRSVCGYLRIESAPEPGARV